MRAPSRQDRKKNGSLSKAVLKGLRAQRTLGYIYGWELGRDFEHLDCRECSPLSLESFAGAY